MARLTKKQIIDSIVCEATQGLFFGDERDGETPPINLQNFTDEMSRHGAKALRARLSGLAYQKVLQEGIDALEYTKRLKERQLASLGQQLASLGQVERAAREERLQANRRQLAAARAEKRNISESIDDIIAKFVGPVLDKHPEWRSHRCAVEIEPQVNKTLRGAERRPLALDAIRKRVKKYRTHAR
jgi:hypothetical protein